MSLKEPFKKYTRNNDSISYLDFQKYKSNQRHVLRDNFSNQEYKLASLPEFSINKQQNYEDTFQTGNKNICANQEAMEKKMDINIIKNCKKIQEFRNDLGLKESHEPQQKKARKKYSRANQHRVEHDDFEAKCNVVWEKRNKRREKLQRIAEKVPQKPFENIEDLVLKVIDQRVRGDVLETAYKDYNQEEVKKEVKGFFSKIHNMKDNDKWEIIAEYQKLLNQRKSDFGEKVITERKIQQETQNDNFLVEIQRHNLIDKVHQALLRKYYIKNALPSFDGNKSSKTASRKTMAIDDKHYKDMFRNQNKERVENWKEEQNFNLANKHIYLTKDGKGSSLVRKTKETRQKSYMPVYQLSINERIISVIKEEITKLKQESYDRLENMDLADLNNNIEIKKINCKSVDDDKDGYTNSRNSNSKVGYCLNNANGGDAIDLKTDVSKERHTDNQKDDSQGFGKSILLNTTGRKCNQIDNELFGASYLDDTKKQQNLSVEDKHSSVQKKKMVHFRSITDGNLQISSNQATKNNQGSTIYIDEQSEGNKQIKAKTDELVDKDSNICFSDCEKVSENGKIEMGLEVNGTMRKNCNERSNTESSFTKRYIRNKMYDNMKQQQACKSGPIKITNMDNKDSQNRKIGINLRKEPVLSSDKQQQHISKKSLVCEPKSQNKSERDLSECVNSHGNQDIRANQFEAVNKIIKGAKR